jgi:hypothetical protein
MDAVVPFVVGVRRRALAGRRDLPRRHRELEEDLLRQDRENGEPEGDDRGRAAAAISPHGQAPAHDGRMSFAQASGKRRGDHG